MAMSDEERKARRKENARRRRERDRETESIVVDLFGAPSGGRNDPDDILGHGQHGPRPAHRKTRPRKKVRLSPNFTEILQRIERGETTMEDVVAAMDPEELARGALRGTDGVIRRPPAVVPAAFYQACIRELLKRGQQLYRSHFLVAIEAFTQIAGDATLEPKDRLKAAQYIWERVEGKVPDRVEIAAAEPWQTIIDGIVAEAEDEQIQRASRILSGGEG